MIPAVCVFECVRRCLLPSGGIFSLLRQPSFKLFRTFLARVTYFCPSNIPQHAWWYPCLPQMILNLIARRASTQPNTRSGHYPSLHCKRLQSAVLLKKFYLLFRYNELTCTCTIGVTFLQESCHCLSAVYISVKARSYFPRGPVSKRTIAIFATAAVNILL